MLNKQDRAARRIVRAARPPSAGKRAQSGSAQAAGMAGASQVSSTIQHETTGEPAMLWIPGIDPWGVRGYYFGSNKIMEDVNVKTRRFA